MRVCLLVYVLTISLTKSDKAPNSSTEYAALIKRLQGVFHDYNKDYFARLAVMLSNERKKEGNHGALYTTLLYIDNKNDLRDVAKEFVDSMQEDQVREELELYATAYRKAQHELALTGELSESRMLQWIDQSRGPLAAGVYEIVKGLDTVAKRDVIAFMVDRAQSVQYVAATLPDKSMTSAVAYLSKVPKIPSYALLSLDISVEVIRSTYLWTQGQISGKRLTANILESVARTGGSVGGAAAGAMIGTIAGPIGTFAGGVAGAMAGSKIAGDAARWTLERLFSLSPNAATDKAYEYLGLSPWASDDVVARKIRDRRREASPDKGGSHDRFVEQEAHIALIKIHRQALRPEEKSWAGVKTEL